MTSKHVVGIDASRSYRAPMTGTERYSRRIIEHLLKLENRDVEYRLYFNDPPPADSETASAEIRQISSRRLWTHYRLSRELRENPVDLLFVPSHVLPIYHPAASVVTVHDLGYLYEPETHTRFSRMELKMTTRWNAARATHLISISDSTRRDLITHCGVEADRITVIPHGVDARFRVLPSEEVDRYRRSARLPDRFVLYLGTVQPRKNIARLISAFEMLAERDASLHLVLGGKTGWLAEPLIRRASESQFQSRIRFLGYVPEEQLPLLYNSASAVALPSLYEGFGLPVIEAMACGVPALMSDRGALPELAGADSMVVDPTSVDAISSGLDELLQFRDDPESIRARQTHARTFSWQASARATRQVLIETLAQSGAIP